MSVARQHIPTVGQVVHRTANYEVKITSHKHKDHEHYAYAVTNTNTHIEEHVDLVLAKAVFMAGEFQKMLEVGYMAYLKAVNSPYSPAGELDSAAPPPGFKLS